MQDLKFLGATDVRAYSAMPSAFQVEEFGSQDILGQPPNQFLLYSNIPVVRMRGEVVWILSARTHTGQP